MLNRDNVSFYNCKFDLKELIKYWLKVDWNATQINYYIIYVDKYIIVL